MRSLLGSGVTRSSLASQSAHFAAYAAEAAHAAVVNATTDALYGDTDHAADAAHAAVFTAAMAAGVESRNVGYATVDIVTSQGAAFWREVERDVEALTSGQDLTLLPLWHGPIPESLAQAETTALAVMTAEYGSDTSFWHRWWAGAKSGQWLNWDLQRDIALIPDEVWKSGIGPVMAEIARIEAGYRSRLIDNVRAFVAEHPYALIVDYDRKTGRLISRPAETCDLSQIIDRIRRALRDFSAACRKSKVSNSKGELQRLSSPAIDRLKKDLKRFANSPLDLHDEVEAAARQMLLDAAETGLHRDTDLLRLVDALRNRCSEIAASSQVVVDTLEKRAHVELKRLKSTVLADAISYCQAMQKDSAGRLEVLSGIAMAALLDPSTAETEKQAAYYFVKAMVPRGALVMAAERERAEADPKPSRGKKVVEVLDGIHKADRAVDAVQENLPEAVDWATRFFTEFQSGNFFGLGG